MPSDSTPPALTTPPPSASQFHYVYVRERLYGPYATAQLADMAWKGTITPETPWCVAGSETWATAAAAPGITFQLRTAPPESGSRPCSRCNGWLVRHVERPQQGFGCLVMLIGLVLTPIIIGFFIILAGIDLKNTQKITWWCNTCGVQVPG